MIRTLTTAVVAILSSVFLLDAAQPRDAEAAAAAPAEAALPTFAADAAWPAPQGPLDTTPITPVESTSAPMDRSL